MAFDRDNPTVDGFRAAMLPFQRAFLRGAFAADVDLACWSLPKGNGKSSTAAWLGARALTPGDELFHPGTESHIIATSVGQARRTTFKLMRRYFPDDGDWRIAETQNAAHIVHKPSKTRVSVLAGNAKTAQGLVDCPIIIGDEPGAWEVNGGADVWAAIRTALGKPESRMKIILIGTLARGSDPAAPGVPDLRPAPVQRAGGRGRRSRADGPASDAVVRSVRRRAGPFERWRRTGR